MIITIEDYEIVRSMYAVEKLSIREISRRTGFSRNTVAKYCKGETMPGNRKEYARDPAVITDKISDFIHSCLEEDEKENLEKQKHTAKRIYDRLVEEQGFQGGESTVRRLVRTMRVKTPEVYIPLDFDPAEAMQIDFGEAVGYHKGLKTKIHIFCARLCYSAMPFVFTAPRKNMETFLEGIKRAFEFFGGVPYKVIFDNDKVAVKRGFGKNAENQPYLAAMAAHYAFRMEYCNRSSGNEKGLVEGLVGWSRKNILVPVPKFDSFDALNSAVKDRCTKYGNTHKIKGRIQPVSEQFRLEQSRLMPMPKYDFNTAKTKDVRVDSLSLIRFEGYKFSVPYEYVGKHVSAKLYATRLEVVHNKEIICIHERPRTTEETVFELSHYLGILERKPRSILNAKPVKDKLTPDLMAFAKHIASNPNELVRFMRICSEHDLQMLEQTIVKGCIKSLDVLCTELGKRGALTPSEKLRAFDSIIVEKCSLNIYDQMIPRSDDHRQC